MRCTSIQFKHFKALADFSLRLEDIAVLVGANNSGKSTIIGACRILEVALRRARVRVPERVVGPDGAERSGWALDPSAMPVSLENVHTDYVDAESSVHFRFEHGNRLTLYFPAAGGCVLVPDAQGKILRNTKDFRAQFPFTLYCVPVLGPLEHREPVIDHDTIQRNLTTTRASRHFRNYWMQNPEGFEEFRQRVASSWPGMTISPPELVASDDTVVTMFCSEQRIDREVFWAGFGFQVWLQLLTHLERGKDANLLVVDEPEIYLHAALQRQLVRLIRKPSGQVLLATHSAEIVGEVEPREIFEIRKDAKSAKRLSDADGVQGVLDLLGSTQHAKLAQLSRAKRVVFVENEDDWRFLQAAGLVGGKGAVFEDVDTVALYSQGFGSWERTAILSEALRMLVRSGLRVGVVLDRDYYPDAQLSEIAAELAKSVQCTVFWGRKEHENYLVDPVVLEAAWRSGPGVGADRELVRATSEAINRAFAEAAGELKAGALSQYLGRGITYHSVRRLLAGESRLDPATIVQRTTKWFNDEWESPGGILRVAPGKALLSNVRARLQLALQWSPSDKRLRQALSQVPLPAELATSLETLASAIA